MRGSVDRGHVDHEVRLVDDTFWPWLQHQQFAVIRLSHVVEHLYQPRVQLGRLVAALAPGGTLHVITPNPDGPTCTLARRRSLFFQVVHVTLIPPLALARVAQSVGAARTDIVMEPTAKDLWRSWLLTMRRVRSYEKASPCPRGQSRTSCCAGSVEHSTGAGTPTGTTRSSARRDGARPKWPVPRSEPGDRSQHAGRGRGAVGARA